MTIHWRNCSTSVWFSSSSDAFQDNSFSASWEAACFPFFDSPQMPLLLITSFISCHGQIPEAKGRVIHLYMGDKDWTDWFPPLLKAKLRLFSMLIINQRTVSTCYHIPTQKVEGITWFLYHVSMDCIHALNIKQFSLPGLCLGQKDNNYMCDHHVLCISSHFCNISAGLPNLSASIFLSLGRTSKGLHVVCCHCTCSSSTLWL